MQTIQLKFDHERCKFLRHDALSVAMEYQDSMTLKLKAGIKNGKLEKIIQTGGFSYSFFVFHNQGNIVVMVTSRPHVTTDNDVYLEPSEG